MTLLPLDLPAGFYRNGTEYEQSNRWRDGSLVRWLDGSLRPIGGWTERKNGFSEHPVRGMHTWQDNGGTAWMAAGSHNQLSAMTGAGIKYDLTPDDLASGREDAAVLTGYGYGFYGTGIWGVPRPVTSDSVPEEATTWQLDNFGQNLVALHSDDGRILEWDRTTTVGSELVTNGLFATDANWNKGKNWYIANGVANYKRYLLVIDANDETVVNATTDVITSNGHDFTDGDEFTYVVPSGQVAIGGLTSGTNYFIVSATTNTFKVAATSGGAAINLLPNNQVTFDADDDAIKDTTNDKIIVSNTFSNGDKVTYDNGSGADIGGLTHDSEYFIINATASEFQLSATSGGSAIDLTPDPDATIDANANIASPTSYTVTVASSGGTNVYFLNGVARPSLQLVRGTTYTFDLSDASNTGHPWEFLNGGATYSTGVTKTGTEGSTGASVTIAVDASAPATGLSYYCTAHGAGMGNTITTIASASPIDYSTETITASAHGFSDGDEVTYTNSSGSDIGGLTTGTNYFVVSSATNTFKLAATSGGSAINLTAPASVTVDGSDAAVVVTASDKIVTSNSFTNGDEVKYFNGNGSDISGLTNNSNYFIINASGSEFQLSATSGGAAISLTAVGGGTSHTFQKVLGNSHNFNQDIGSAHIIRQHIGSSHQLNRVNFGNLDQTVSGLVATPDTQDTYDFTITLIDRDEDNDLTVDPDVVVKVTGTTSTTELVNATLVIGENNFRFGSDDTEVKIEVIPQANDTPTFDIDTVSLQKKTVAAVIANAPTNNKGIVVTEERFIFALGAGGNSRKVQWCDKENNTVWTAAATNEAGDLELATAGQIMQGIRTRGSTLILTDTDAHVAQYIGPPYVYSFARVGTQCGAVSRLSAVTTDQGAFWYGQENFHYFDGNTVQVLPCDVHDYVFGDFNNAQQSKVWGMANGANNEVWWFYPSSSSTEIDRYVAYDTLEKHWLIGNLSRTAGVSRGVFAYPFMAGEYTETITLTVTVADTGSGNKYYVSGFTGEAPTVELKKGNTYRFDQSDSSNATHPLRFSAVTDGVHSQGVEYEEGVTVVGTAGTAGAYTEIVVNNNAPTLYYYCTQHSGMGNDIEILEPVTIFNHEIGVAYSNSSVFCETGPISIGNGDNVAKVTQIIPDEKTQGDVQMTFKTRFHPNDTERSYGPIDPTNPTSLRFSGRQVRMRVSGDQSTDWRVGTMRLEVKAGGKR